MMPSKKENKIKKKPIKLCAPETCDHCIALGEGDFACDKDDKYVLVVENYIPTDDVLYCVNMKSTKVGKRNES